MTQSRNPGALARRDVLIASGAAVAGAARPLRADAPRPAQATSVEGTSPRAFGAIGDGQYHALSDRFPSLAAARAAYPFVEHLGQSIDWAGIQAAIDSVEGSGGAVTIPVGRFVISDSLRLPSAVTLRGEARNGSVLDNQNHRLDAPQIVNKDTVAFLYATIRDLTLNGGTHAIKVRATREVAGIVMEGLTANLQTEGNIVFSSMQTTMIRDCHLMDGKHGISVEGFPCNSVHLDNTRLGRHSDAAIRLRGADGFVMSGGSIEAGGVAGKGTIDIETGGAYANAVHFRNVYFENTHEFLLRSRSAGTIAFHACKITGTGAQGQGMGPYRFDCADDLIVFDDNHWDLPTLGPMNMLLQGRNDRLGGEGTCWSERSGRKIQVESRRFTIDEAKRGLFDIDFGDRSGRALGDIELYLETGNDHAVHRLLLPLNVTAPQRGTTQPLLSIGEVQLAITASQPKLRLALHAAPGGFRHLWFRLGLSGYAPGGMDVKVL